MAQTTEYRSELIPECKKPETLRRGIWSGGKLHRLERGYCPNFINAKSFNANAGLSAQEQDRNEKILTLYKWFTRNSETNMDEPIPLALLHDRKFVAAAEAMITKKLVAAKHFAENLQPIYETSSSK